MATPSIAARVRLAELLPVAIAEDWGEERLAKEARVGNHAARAALNRKLGEVLAVSNESASQLLATMQREASQERPAVIGRLKAAGSAADALLAKAREMIEALDVGEDLPGDDDESGPVLRPRCKATVEARLASLATVVKAASAASRESWETFKDASGLAFAEEQTRAALKAGAKEARPALVPSMIVEILPEDGE